METAQKRMNIVKERFNIESQNTHYKTATGKSGGGATVRSSSSNGKNAPSIIVDALAGDKTLKPLVLRNEGDSYDSTKTWEFLTEFEKEEEKKKHMMHYLG